jgi:hypothetical protein
LFVTSVKQSPSDDRGCWSVQLQELAATLQVLLQSRRLPVAPALAEAPLLARVLAAFQAKVSEAAETEMDAWRQGTRDDLKRSEKKRTLWSQKPKADWRAPQAQADLLNIGKPVQATPQAAKGMQPGNGSLLEPAELAQDAFLRATFQQDRGDA